MYIIYCYIYIYFQKNHIHSAPHKSVTFLIEFYVNLENKNRSMHNMFIY